MTPEDFDRAVGDILGAVAAMTLATCSDGSPWATPVYFAPWGPDLVFLSSPDSRHCRNLAGNPACSAAVYPEAASWRAIRGVQMEGQAGPVMGLADKAGAMAAYMAKFPFVRELVAAPGEAARRLGRISPHVFRPARIRYLDNALGFGTRYAVCLTGGKPDGPPEREESA